MAGVLYLVATPIGNFDDMTFRALNVLKNVDLVIYEERREGERLLRHFDIEKPVESLGKPARLAETKRAARRRVRDANFSGAWFTGKSRPT